MYGILAVLDDAKTFILSFIDLKVTQQKTIPISGQQIINVNSAGQIVTPKTKTALANLLNTRLQTGNISPNSKEPAENVHVQVSI